MDTIHARWSNNHNYAVEFDIPMSNRDIIAQALLDSLTEYRKNTVRQFHDGATHTWKRFFSPASLHLHINDTWCNPGEIRQRHIDEPSVISQGSHMISYFFPVAIIAPAARINIPDKSAPFTTPDNDRIFCANQTVRLLEIIDDTLQWMGTIDIAIRDTCQVVKKTSGFSLPPAR